MITTEIKIITFSHEYQKLMNINHEEPVMLLEVFQKKVADMSLDFLAYDTIFKTPDGKEFHYSLNKGEYLVLLFGDSYGNLFTTIRSRWNKQGDKLDYYLKSRGEKFKVIFKIQE